MILSQKIQKESGSRQSCEFQESPFDNKTSDFEVQFMEKESMKESGLEQDFQQTFASTYTNLCSGQEIQGTFCIYRGFLGHVNVELTGGVMFLQNLSYARFEKRGNKVVFKKDQIFFELEFNKKKTLSLFVEEIAKVCIYTDFNKKYHILKLTEIKPKFKICVVESKENQRSFTAKLFDKKVLIDPQNTQQKRAMMNEIEALRILQGKGIFDLLEVHETEHNICLVTELVHEDTLHNLLQDLDHSFSLSIETVQTIIFNILQALSILASFGIIHRNIKPSNILIEDDAKIKIINFNLVTCTSALITSFKPCGTPGYTAPEVFNKTKNDKVYNEKCDVFSAGCIFFEMLFGYPLSEELFSGSLSFNKVTVVDIKKSIDKAISKRKDRINCEGLELLLLLLQDDPEKRISAEDALHHPYFQKKENEETNIMNSPDVSPVFTIAQENFTNALKLDSIFDSKCLCDEDTLDISDEGPEMERKCQSLNQSTWEKHPSIKWKQI